MMTNTHPEPIDRFVEVNRTRLHVRDWGGPDAGAALVLVHGLASNARIWGLTAPLLSQERRTLALDQRGHGLSDKPVEGYGYDVVSADLAGTIQALGLARPIVVGHSWGASVAVQLAADHPELVSAIALLDGATVDFQGRMTLDEALERLAPPRLAGTPLAEFLPRVRSRWETLGWSEEVEAAIMGNFQVDGEHIAPHLTFENHLQIVRAMWAQRLTELYPRVMCPVLIVPADSPPPTADATEWQNAKRRGVEAAAATMPHATVVWAYDTVHDIPLHRPAWLAEQLLAFARSVAHGEAQSV
jgi:pimeloyl-ACP methyl ester carboxylesterase